MRIAISVLAISIAGCAATPTQPVGTGQIMRVTETATGKVIMQVTAESPDRCRGFVERVRATKGYAGGEAIVVCTNVDEARDVPVRSTFLDEWDGSSFTLNAKTGLMCEYMSKTFLANRLPGLERPRFKQTMPCTR